MELIFAAVLATLFVLVTAAFHLPAGLLDRRRGASHKIAWDAPRDGTR